MALQQPVLRLAGDRGGRLTVTEVASSLGWPLRRAEKVLNSLEDGLRVASTVTDQGVIVYEFRELMHARRVSAAEMDALLIPGAPAQAQRAQAQAQPLPLPRDGTLSAGGGGPLQGRNRVESGGRAASTEMKFRRPRGTTP